MTVALDPEIRRLRRLKDGGLADEAGQLRAAIARIKDEAIRRELRRAEGELFRLSLSPPGKQHRLDVRALEDTYTRAVIDTFRHETDTDWDMRVYPRRGAR